MGTDTSTMSSGSLQFWNLLLHCHGSISFGYFSSSSVSVILPVLALSAHLAVPGSIPSFSVAERRARHWPLTCTCLRHGADVTENHCLWTLLPGRLSLVSFSAFRVHFALPQEPSEESLERVTRSCPVVFSTRLPVTSETLLTQWSFRRYGTSLHRSLRALLWFVDNPSLCFWSVDCVSVAYSSPASETLERSLLPFLPTCRCTESRSQCSSSRTCRASYTRRTLRCAARAPCPASFAEAH